MTSGHFYSKQSYSLGVTHQMYKHEKNHYEYISHITKCPNLVAQAEFTIHWPVVSQKQQKTDHFSQHSEPLCVIHKTRLIFPN